MPLGTEHALVAVVSVAAIVIGVALGGIWLNVGTSNALGPAGAVVSPAAFNAPPFCEHRIEPKNGVHQIIVRVNPLTASPPPPPEGIRVEARMGAEKVAQGVTDIFGCTSLDVPRAQSYVFEASVDETDENATHRWWSNAVTRYYDGESPGFIELRLNNYARYGAV